MLFSNYSCSKKIFFIFNFVLNVFHVRHLINQTPNLHLYKTSMPESCIFTHHSQPFSLRRYKRKYRIMGVCTIHFLLASMGFFISLVLLPQHAQGITRHYEFNVCHYNMILALYQSICSCLKASF